VKRAFPLVRHPRKQLNLRGIWLSASRDASRNFLRTFPKSIIVECSGLAFFVEFVEKPHYNPINCLKKEGVYKKNCLKITHLFMTIQNSINYLLNFQIWLVFD